MPTQSAPTNSPSPLLIRRFTTDDVDFAVEQTRREGWDNTPAIFHLFLAHDPDGCFIAEFDGERVGMVTTTRYQQSAWVGNLIVTPSFRRQGIGRDLMRYALDHLDAGGVRSVSLEADPDGVALYKSLGFAGQFDSPRFRKNPPHKAECRSAESAGTIESMELSDIQQAYELDAKCFGDDRNRFLRELMNLALVAFCARKRGRILAYGLALPSAVGVRLGPCVSEDPALAGLLIGEILAAFSDQPVIAAIPGANESATQTFRSHGFEQMRSSLRMHRGDEVIPAIRRGTIVALANGATG